MFPLLRSMMVLALVMVAVGCSTQQMQKTADVLNKVEVSMCAAFPDALAASKVANAAAVAMQQTRPGTDADKAVAAANLELATMTKLSDWCLAKGYTKY